MFGLGIAELVLLGGCCVLPVFVVGGIAFLLMFRSGEHEYGDAPGMGPSGGGVDEPRDKGFDGEFTGTKPFPKKPE